MFHSDYTKTENLYYQTDSFTGDRLYLLAVYNQHVSNLLWFLVKVYFQFWCNHCETSIQINCVFKNHLQICKMDDIVIVETPSNLCEEATIFSTFDKNLLCGFTYKWSDLISWYKMIIWSDKISWSDQLIIFGGIFFVQILILIFFLIFFFNFIFFFPKNYPMLKSMMEFLSDLLRPRAF